MTKGLCILWCWEAYKNNGTFNLKKWVINVGGQYGSSWIKPLNASSWAWLTYAISTYHFSTHGRWVLGGYYANPTYQGFQNQQVGMMTGFEYALTDRWYLMGDWLSGQNDMGEGVIGGMYVLTPKIQLCTGMLWSNPTKFQGMVLELNVLGW